MIKLQNITHSYEGQVVLEDFSLEMMSHETTAILGSSGCGKTTILRLIAGLETPESGLISIGGKTVAKAGKMLIPPYQRDIGFIFQDLGLWPHFSVYRNVSFGLEERRSNAIEQKVMEILDFFGLAELKDRFPHQLSGGQKQLVAIARSLVLQPEILLLDEPMSSLDVLLKKKLLNHVLRIKSEFNLTLVYVTHDHREAFRIADRIAVLNDRGALEGFDTCERILKSDNAYIHYFLDY